jgi:hypothetical protein
LFSTFVTLGVDSLLFCCTGLFIIEALTVFDVVDVGEELDVSYDGVIIVSWFTGLFIMFIHGVQVFVFYIFSAARVISIHVSSSSSLE